MKKFQQIILTGKQSDEFRETGRTVYPYGGVGHVIEANEFGKPVVTGLVPLADVEYEIVLRAKK